MKMSRLVPALCALVAVLAAPAAHADNPRVNTQIFRPSAHSGDLISTMLTDIEVHTHWSASLMLHFGKNPLVFVDQTAGEVSRHEVIQNQFAGDLMGSIALFDRLSIGLAIPVFMVNSGEASGFVPLDPAVSSFALGDIRLSTKVGIVQRERDADGFGFAAALDFSLPTGQGDSFVSDPFTLAPVVMADFRLGELVLAANIGFRIRTATTELYDFATVGSEFFWRLGGAYDVVPGQLAVIGELYGSSSDWTAANNTHMEGILAGRLTLPETDLAITVGGGSGFTRGYGNTKFRIFAGVQYAPAVILDADQDGIIDEYDSCPNDPEDFDGFQDSDGCPDPDNDGDGIPDGLDKCPNDAEDMDGFQDADGCPDLDNDGDGIPDADDKCPNDPEDFDGFEDADGCPDPDNDGDGILDEDDKCPNEPETFNEFEDDDGCPDETLAKVESGKIVIAEKIFFDTGKATIKEESFPVMMAVKGILKTNPQIKRVVIEGHTDDVGNDARNKKLSDDRAKSVKQWLIDKGIEPERLEAIGYGEERPAVEGRTREAREANRRVEFIIKGD